MQMQMQNATSNNHQDQDLIRFQAASTIQSTTADATYHSKHQLTIKHHDSNTTTNTQQKRNTTSKQNDNKAEL